MERIHRNSHSFNLLGEYLFQEGSNVHRHGFRKFKWQWQHTQHVEAAWNWNWNINHLHFCWNHQFYHPFPCHLSLCWHWHFLSSWSCYKHHESPHLLGHSLMLWPGSRNNFSSHWCRCTKRGFNASSIIAAIPECLNKYIIRQFFFKKEINLYCA